jgi:transcription initiation factor TFIIIB Brf1 subunit/transcription initiation factor TFIIB
MNVIDQTDTSSNYIIDETNCEDDESTQDLDFNLDDFTEEDYSQFGSLNVSEYVDSSITVCVHTRYSTVNNVRVCDDCGEELCKELSLQPEWRFYGSNDTKYSSDPSRCCIRKSEEKNIYSDLKAYDISQEIKDKANEYYLVVTDGEIHRGAYRKSIIYACIFNALKELGTPEFPDKLSKQFGLTRKQLCKGITKFSTGMVNYKKKMNITNKTAPKYISPLEFIPKIMSKFSKDQIHVTRITQIYETAKLRAKWVGRSNPQSIVCGLVYYYLRMMGTKINISEFATIMGISELLVMRISKMLNETLRTTESVTL